MARGRVEFVSWIVDGRGLRYREVLIHRRSPRMGLYAVLSDPNNDLMIIETNLDAALRCNARTGTFVSTSQWPSQSLAKMSLNV